MSYFDDASLVMIPSGYKTSKVYSVKPTDGSGDLTFSRSNDTATRVNSAGLIEKVRTNLILQSNTFSNAAWIKLGAGTGTAPVLTANYTTDPFGGNNAWRFQCNLNGGTTSSDRSWIYQTFAGSPSNGTLSVYVKLNSAGSVNLVFSDGGGTTQTITSTTWVRLSTPSTTTGEFRLGLIGYNGTNTCDLSIAFVQVETGDIATDYIATTSAAVSVGPVANVPRLDYLGSTCGKLILEPQRTNALLSSEDWTTNWSGSNRSVTANNIVSPDGYQNADKLSATGGSAYYAQVRTTASGANTFSVFLKYGDKTTQSIYAYSSGSYFAQAAFNLQAGTVASTASGTASIQDYGNGWYRCSVSGTAGSSTIEVGIEGIGVGTYTYAWGAQLEAGAYATSYIPTLGAAVTRGADACSKTGISSLIGQTEGTLFVDLSDVNDLDFPEITIDNNNNTDRIVLTRSAAGNWGFFVASSAASTFSAYSSVSSTSGKFALAYSSAGYALYRNGVQIVTGTYNLPTALSAIRFNGRSSSDFFASKCVKQAIIFPTRLSAADLAALTA